MVTIYYSVVNAPPENVITANIEQTLPLVIREKIAAYASSGDRALRIAGKWLLGQQLVAHSKNPVISLDHLAYNEWGKPYFPRKNIQFSIAHSGRLAICAYAERTRAIGIDIEWMKPIRPADVEDYLTRLELAAIKSSPQPNTHFYELWTRKEAILKASGNGVGIPFASVDVTHNPVFLDGQQWYWHPIQILPEYIIHLATTNASEEIRVVEIPLASSDALYVQ